MNPINPYNYKIEKTGDSSFDLKIEDKITHNVATVALNSNDLKDALGWKQTLWNNTIGLFFAKYKWVPLQLENQKTVYVFNSKMQNLQFRVQKVAAQAFQAATKSASLPVSTAPSPLKIQAPADKHSTDTSRQPTKVANPLRFQGIAEARPSTDSDASSVSIESVSPKPVRLLDLNTQEIDSSTSQTALRSLICKVLKKDVNCSEKELLKSVIEKLNFLQASSLYAEDKALFEKLDQKYAGSKIDLLGITLKELNETRTFAQTKALMCKVCGLSPDSSLDKIESKRVQIRRELKSQESTIKPAEIAMYYLKKLESKFINGAFLEARSTLISQLDQNPRVSENDLLQRASLSVDNSAVKSVYKLYEHATIPYLGVSISKIKDAENLDDIRQVLLKMTRLPLTASDEELMEKLSVLDKGLKENSDFESKIATTYFNEAIRKFVLYSEVSTPAPLEIKKTPVPLLGINEEDVNPEILDKDQARELLCQVLKLNSSVTDSEIRTAYRKMCLKIHPDRNSTQEAAQAMKTLGNLYEIYQSK